MVSIIQNVKLLIFPVIGILIIKSHFSETNLDIPLPSAPITKQVFLSYLDSRIKQGLM